jgi:glycosyltransferase involved in cell wall biosynthesis
MPAYNAEQFLKGAVASTLRIMKTSDELIVIDDGSSDSTKAILSNIRDNRIRVISNSSNLGVAESLNRGLSIASAEYIGRIDADDLCLPWRRRVHLRDESRVKADFYFSPALILFSNSKILVPQKSTLFGLKNLGEQLESTNPFVHSSMIARKSAIESLGGYRRVAAEDFDLWKRAHASGKVFFKGKIPTVIHRVHRNQLTRSGDWLSRIRKERGSGLY